MIYAILFMVIGSYPDTISYRAVFADSQLTFETIQGWDFVELEDALYITEPGYPALPRASLVFAIPAGSGISDVEYFVEDSLVLNGSYSILPAQPPIPISWEDTVPTVDPDSVIYGLTTIWPDKATQGSELGSMDVTELGRVEVFPLAWNPSTGELTLRETIDIDIILEEDLRR